MHTVPDKMENIRTAGAYIEKVSAQKPDFVILPEMFCCPYQTENFYAVIEKQRKLEKEVSAIVNGRTKNHDPRGKKSREA